MKKFQCLIYVAFLLISPLIFADSKELFKEVNHKKSQKLSEYNDLFLRKALYFSARHRLVQINTSLLTSSNKDGKFILNLFDDVTINVQSKRMTFTSPFHGAWYGEMETAPSINDEINQLTAYERGNFSTEEFKSFFTDIVFYFEDWDVDLVANSASFSHENKVGITSTVPIQDTALPKLKRRAFRTVSGRFTELFSGRTFVIMPLKYTPKYHVIYEQDDSKTFTTANDVPGSEPLMSPEEILEDENLLKAIELEVFLDSLPKEEPGKIIKGDLL